MFERILAWDNLCRAWQQTLQNHGAPGVDQVTLARWERNWETNLTRLAHMARANTYQPGRARRIYFVKPDGGQREISILNVTDRVFQRAALNIIGPLFERRFLPCSYGYRPKRSAPKALQSVLLARANGLTHVLDADILGCFDHLDHALIMRLVSPIISDTRTCDLITRWLESGARRTARDRRARKPGVGVPLGAPLSPLWCNVVLHELDQALHDNHPHIHLVRYADDFVLFGADAASIRDALDQVTATLSALKLTLHPTKTWLTTFEAGFDFLGVHFEGDAYRYVHRQKHIESRASDVRLLRLYPPEPYAGRW